MFGKNALSKQDRGDGLTLLVHSIFGTIQGEGPLAGTPAVFVRLAGCNLACHFCDTEFEKGAERLTVLEIFERIDAELTKVKASLIVLTGGEPLRQNVVHFIRYAFRRKMDVQVETAGTLWPEGLDDLMGEAPDDWGKCTLVCSPKTGNVHPKIQQWCRDWKYIVAVGENDPDDGLPVMSTQRVDVPMKLYRPRWGRIWLQPREDYFHPVLGGPSEPDRDSTYANMQLAAQIAMRHGYRLTLQQHKILDLP